MWQCDGCGLVGTEDEVEAHLNAQPLEEDLSKVKCWGSMEVGGKAWTDMQVHGIHPMQQVVSDIRKLVNKRD